MTTVATAPLQLSVKPAEAYLHQGQVVAFATPTVVTTVLGSCVSVCLWDERAGVGGANHFLLPEPGPGQAPSAHYARPAFEQLLARLAALRARPDRLQAKIFGGATLARIPETLALGERNVEIARLLLAERGIPLVAEGSGGGCGRKLRFETHSGTAWLRLLGECS